VLKISFFLMLFLMVFAGGSLASAVEICSLTYVVFYIFRWFAKFVEDLRQESSQFQAVLCSMTCV